MINVDILGYFDEEVISKIDKPNMEFFEIEKLTEGEKFQDVLIISIPTKKGKFRKKGYKSKEVSIINDYLTNGGNVILLYPINQKYFNLMDEFFEQFEFSAVLNEQEKLLHVNPNLVFFEKSKSDKYLPGKKFVKKYVHFLFPHNVETLVEGNHLPVIALKRMQKGNLFLYGLGYNNFWKEDIERIFKYLLLKYEDLMEDVEEDQEFVLKLINQASKFKQNLITKIYSRNYKDKYTIDDVLTIKDDYLRQKIANGLTDQDFYDLFNDLNEKKIESYYIEYKNLFEKYNYQNALYFLNKVMVKFIIKGRITFEKFKKLIENEHLPEEALSLIIYFTKPLSPTDFRNYRFNVNKLIQWNKKVKYLSERKIKDKLYDISEIEEEQYNKWEKIKQKERDKEFQLREQRRIEREKRDQMIKEMEVKKQERIILKEKQQQERTEKEKEKQEILRELRKQKHKQEREEMVKEQKEREKRFQEIKQRKLEEKRKRQIILEEQKKEELAKIEILKQRREELEKEKIEKDLLLKKEIETQDGYMKEVRERLQFRLSEINRRKAERLEKARITREKLSELRKKRYTLIQKQEEIKELIKAEAPTEVKVEIPQETVEPEVEELELIPQIIDSDIEDNEIVDDYILPLMDLLLSPLDTLIEIMDFRQENRKEILYKSDEGETLLYMLELILTPKERIQESLELKTEMEDLY